MSFWYRCLAMAGLLVIFAVFADSGRAHSQPISQPISYNHKVHIDNKLECTFCHTSAEQREVAGRPTADICMMCHSQIEGPASSQIAEYVKRKQPIPWNRIYDVPEFVYFSHRRHTKVAELECSTCHGDVSGLTKPAEKPLVDLSMSFCIDCHRARDVSAECTACHR